jgi:hypothetical protein
MRRVHRHLPVGAAALLCALGLLAVPASAKFASGKLPFVLGPVGEPNAIATDQTTGNVYVTDRATNTVKVFGKEGGTPAAGVPSEITGAETPNLGFQFGGGLEPAGVAVDDSGGVNVENVYVADTKNHALDRFKLNGGRYEYVCQFKGYGNTGDGCLPNKVREETSPAQPFGAEGVGGVAVDSHGNVYASDLSAHMVYEFNAAGEDVSKTVIPADPSKPGGGEPAGLAVDANGVVYVQDYQGPIYRMTPRNPHEFEVAMFSTENARAVAVDPANNYVFADDASAIDIYDEHGTLLDSLSEGFESEGVAAVGAVSGYLYVSNTFSKSIDVYELAQVPDVTSCVAETVTPTTAKLHGEINPEGTADASYYFEYGPFRALAVTTSDEPVPPTEGFLSAGAEVSGLEPNTEYGCRLVGTNSSGLLDKAAEVAFTTLGSPPEVSVLTASEVTANSVLLSGDVNPENTPPTAYRFEYAEAATEARAMGEWQPLAEVEIGASFAPIPVEEALPAGLKAGTEYSYRLTAVNSAGRITSLEQTFTTSPAAGPPDTPPIVGAGLAESVSQNSAVLTGTVLPRDLPALYEFEVGPTPAYGTVMPGGEVEAESALQEVTVRQPAGGLQPGVTYHFRLVAYNAAGIEYGPDSTFTTTAPASVAVPAGFPILSVPVFPVVKYPPLKHKAKKHTKAKKRKRRGKSKKRSV